MTVEQENEHLKNVINELADKVLKFQTLFYDTKEKLEILGVEVDY